MHSRFRAKSVTLVALAALMALLALPGTLLAKPKPGVPGRGFRLQARAIGALTINRVYCGLAATGEICVDSTNSSTIGGGYWPKGSPQQYVFNSGLQAAGTIDPASNFAWDGDTTGAFFFDPKGTTQHGQLVQPIWNYSDPNDKANWPLAANVPQGDASADNFDVNLQGLPSASQGDVWTIAWDGDPSLIAGRPHPLGIAVETRGLGWNYPAGNEDIVYFIYTFYNISSADPASYAAIRPGMQDQMIALGQQFQALNNAAFGITMPVGGYTIKDFYANFSADMDVSSDAGANYSSVNLPFALGYVYEHTFRGPEGNYRLPSADGNPPFTNGYGFVGVKYLKSPVVAGQEVGIRLFSNTVNGGAFGDPANTYQLYRYVSGNINPGLGDGLCNFSPIDDKICFVKNDAAADMRFFQSSGPFDLAPGEFGSIVVGYVFASATASPGCNVAGCAGVEVRAGDPRLLSDAGNLASLGANLIDSMTGFRGYTDSHGLPGDPNPDGVVQQDEFATIKGSLLGKSLVAQTVFNSKFLLPSAPSAPEFFLVPGDNNIAVFWRPSTTESTGDLFFSASANPGTPANPNLLYDPNYRQYDIEGYRIYRGRQDNPSTLSLLAQYDYLDFDANNHDLHFNDFLGVVAPTPGCAPELGVQADCSVPFDTATPGVAFDSFTVNRIGGGPLLEATPFIQVRLGDRVLLANGDALVIKSDTSVQGSQYGGAPLANEGVPFTFVDRTAKNNLRYFYAVTAFDVNSIQSGPSSLESARITKSAIPVHPASNYDNTGNIAIGIFGRGVNMSEVIPKDPAINISTGIFSGSQRPATGASIGFVGDFIKQVVTQNGAMSVRLDSLALGNLDADNGCGTPGTPNHYFLTLSSADSTVPFELVVQTDCFNARVTRTGTLDGGPIDDEKASRYGGSDDYHLQGQYSLTYPGAYYLNMNGRGCVNTANESVYGTACDYNGARWFAGPAPANNETFPHPNRGNGQNGTAPGVPSNFTNAGSLPGVAVINQAIAYQTVQTNWRTVEASLSGAVRAADFNVYFGATPGHVDSVVDYTHNVQVPFDSMRLAGSYGFLTATTAPGATSFDQTTDVSLSDFSCVPGLKGPAGVGPMIAVPCPAATTYHLTQTASLGAIRHMGSTLTTVRTRATAAGQGFAMYLSGKIFMFEFPTVAPTLPSNTVWTMRSYAGGISGGGGTVGTGGNDGNYSFKAEPGPFTAVGATLQAAYTVTNQVGQATETGLSKVHTVPDPYYVTNGYEASPTNKIIKFVNLPVEAIVRIYSTSGVLVRVLEHNSSTFGGSLDWDVRNRNNQVVASGVYFYHIEAPSGERRVGRMTIVNFAQ